VEVQAEGGGCRAGVEDAAEEAIAGQIGEGEVGRPLHFVDDHRRTAVYTLTIERGGATAMTPRAMHGGAVSEVGFALPARRGVSTVIPRCCRYTADPLNME